MTIRDYTKQEDDIITNESIFTGKDIAILILPVSLVNEDVVDFNKSCCTYYNDGNGALDYAINHFINKGIFKVYIAQMSIDTYAEKINSKGYTKNIPKDFVNSLKGTFKKIVSVYEKSEFVPIVQGKYFRSLKAIRLLGLTNTMFSYSRREGKKIIASIPQNEVEKYIDNVLIDKL